MKFSHATLGVYLLLTVTTVIGIVAFLQPTSLPLKLLGICVGLIVGAIQSWQWNKGWNPVKAKAQREQVTTEEYNSGRTKAILIGTSATGLITYFASNDIRYAVICAECVWMLVVFLPKMLINTYYIIFHPEQIEDA